MGIQFVTDSTADLPVAYLNEHHIRVIPFIYRFGDKEYFDSPYGGEQTLTRAEFYDAMRGGLQPSTSQINLITYTEVFEEVLAAGDDVFYVAFSSGLTGSQNNANLARQALEEKYPGRRVYIVDSLGASLGEGMLVMMAVDALKEGKSGDEIEEMLNEAKTHIHHWITVEDLVYLKRGGRISSATAVVGTMLSIKPMINIDDEGHLIPQERVKGRKRAIKALTEHLKEKAGDSFRYLTLAHTEADEAEIELLRESVRQATGRDVDMVSNITPIIGAHTGPGLLGLLFYAPGSRR